MSTQVFELQVAFTGPDPRAMAAAVHGLGLFEGDPTVLLIDNRRQELPGANWLQVASSQAKLGWSAWFGGEPGELLTGQGPYGMIKEEYGAIKLIYRPWKPSMAHLAEILEAVPFHLASTFTLYPAWFNPPTPRVQVPFIRFSSAHHPHGFAAAMRGPGHLAMVSPRWLEQGPWKVWRQGDISIVQFHDLDADEDEAFRQAEPGWFRFGRSDEGGLLPPDAVPLQNSTYVIPEKLLRIDVPGELSPKELNDLASWRVRRTKHPIEQVRLVFANKAVADMHVYQCWIRGLECCFHANGTDYRVDEGYSIAPMKPDWVVALKELR